MHGTKRQDFTDEVTRSNVDPSRSSASTTTILPRYGNVSLFKLLNNWSENAGRNESICAQSRQEGMGCFLEVGK